MDGNHLSDRLLKPKAAADYLGLAEGTVRNKASAGEIPYKKVGSALRFRKSELDAWIEAETEKAKVAAGDEAADPEAAA